MIRINVAFLIALFLVGCTHVQAGHLRTSRVNVGSHPIEFAETTTNCTFHTEHQFIAGHESVTFPGDQTRVVATESNVVVNGTTYRLNDGDSVNVVDGKVSIKQKQK